MEIYFTCTRVKKKKKEIKKKKSKKRRKKRGHRKIDQVASTKQKLEPVPPA